MPELPDVETFRKYFNRTSLNKKIKDISFDSKARQILGNSKTYLKKELSGKKFRETKRHGKHLFVRISGKEKVLQMHFGMTGFLKSYKNKDSKPEHARVVFSFSDGKNLAYDCQRLLGEITLENSIEKFISKNNLGKDALEITKREFIGIFRNKRGTIKSALMSQKDIAGIGNIYADEILFQSGIKPDKKLDNIKEDKLKKIYENIKKILKKAIEKDANPEEFPGKWIIPYRKEGEKCPECKGKIKTIKISGRTTYYCPDCQK